MPLHLKARLSGRIAIIGDLHLGKTLYGYDLTPHVRRAMYSFLDFCRRERVRSAVCLGDIYDRPAPSATTRKIAAQWANEFQREGIYLYLLAGNHDAASSADAPTALEGLRVLTASPSSIVRVIDRPTLIEGSDLLLLPFPSPGIFASREDYDRDAQRAARGHASAVVLAHLTLDGAKVGEQDFPYHGAEHGLPAFVGRQLVIAGHVHKPQWVSPLRCIVGAAERTSFAERSEPRCFALLTRHSNSERLELSMVLRPDTLPLVQVEPDVSAWGSGGHPPTTEEIIAEHAPRVAEALVKITPFIDDHAAVDWSRVEAGLLEAGALRVFMGPAVRVQPARAKRKTGLATADPEVAATRYIRQRVVDKRERKRMLEVFKRMQKEAEHGVTREV